MCRALEERWLTWRETEPRGYSWRLAQSVRTLPMNNSIAAASAALVLSATSIAIVLIDTAPGAGDSGHELAPAAPDAGLLQRIEALEAENSALRERALALEMEPSVDRAPAVGFTSEEDFEAFREEVRAALQELSSGSVLTAKVESPEFRDKLASTMQEIKVDEASRVAAAKLQSRLDSLDDHMLVLEGELGLTAQQSQSLRSALSDKYSNDAELRRRWRAGEDDQALGQLKRDNYSAHESALSGILSTDQLEAYRVMSRAGK